MIYCFEDSTHTRSSEMSPASTYKVINKIITEPNSSELKNNDDGPPSKNAENATSSKYNNIVKYLNNIVINYGQWQTLLWPDA